MSGFKPKDKMPPEDQRNLLIFAVLFGVVYLLFDALILQPHMQKIDAYHQSVEQEQAEAKSDQKPPPFQPREEVVKKDKTRRATFAHESLHGSINLRGGRIDDITLRNYFETLDKQKQVPVMSPVGTKFPRYAEMGWLRQDGSKTALPDSNAEWEVISQDENALTLQWQNDQGVAFERRIEVKDNFLLKITQKVINQSPQELTLFPYALISEHGLPKEMANRWIIHEGPVGFINDRLQERDYENMSEKPNETIESQKGWIGFTEQYWLTAILPEQKTEKTFRYAYRPPQAQDSRDPRYQADILGGAHIIPANESNEHTIHIFAGAKELWTLQKYGRDLNVESFDAAIDFGWLWFLTKPFFTALLWINHSIGYFAVTILIFAFLLRAAVFPLANTSFRSFAKMKVITPKIMELKEQHGEDKLKLQQELVELYKREKVNPAAGCLPILIQIPIFFSLFKVLNVAIEMRHAPGLFWVHDLSAPDPTSLFNLFNLLPYDVPAFLVIGAWPCLMAVTLMVQQSMNPPPTDPVIRDMFRFLPLIILFVMSGFAAGLVIYWTFSNILSVAQQYMIMRMMGVKVEFFQGWFGREAGPSNIDKASANFLQKDGDEHEQEAFDPNKVVLEEEIEETLDDVAEGGHYQPAITPPKPRKKKKKKT